MTDRAVIWERALANGFRYRVTALLKTEDVLVQIQEPNGTWSADLSDGVQKFIQTEALYDFWRSHGSAPFVDTFSTVGPQSDILQAKEALLSIYAPRLLPSESTISAAVDILTQAFPKRKKTIEGVAKLMYTFATEMQTNHARAYDGFRRKLELLLHE